MVKKNFLFGIAAGLSIIINAAWADPEISPGRWEITSRTDMAGMPPQSVTSVQCIKLGDPIPFLTADPQNCRIEDRSISGDTISWKIICDGEGGRMTGTGQITYYGDTMKGKMTMAIAGTGMEIKNTLSGRRVGECECDW